MNTAKVFLRILFAGALASACASGPKARPESAKRVPDSAPDKIAAQRATAGLHLEEDDQRWGFDAARERKLRREPARNQPLASPVTTPPAAAPGRLDLQRAADPGAR